MKPGVAVGWCVALLLLLTVVNTSAQSVTLTCVRTENVAIMLLSCCFTVMAVTKGLRRCNFASNENKKHPENVLKQLIKGEVCNVLRKKQRHHEVTF